MKNILLIGRGPWSLIYQKTILDFPEINLTVCGKDWKDHVQCRCEGNCDCFPSGVIICTPPDTHVEIASYFLEKNIPCLIEKPLALSYEDAVKLKQFKTPVLVNNIHLFSDNFQKLKRKKDKITLVWSVGGNDGPIRSYSSLYDYGWHEISKGLDLLGTQNIIIDPLSYLHKKDNKEYLQYFIKVNGIQLEGYFGNGFSTKEQYTNVFYNYHPEDTDDYDVEKYHPLEIKDNPLPLHNVITQFLEIINGESDYSNLDFSLEVQKTLDECYKLSVNKIA